MQCLFIISPYCDLLGITPPLSRLPWIVHLLYPWSCESNFAHVVVLMKPLCHVAAVGISLLEMGSSKMIWFYQLG